MPDIVRDPAILKRKRLRQAGYAAVGVIIVIGVSIALARMEPAAPNVERATVLVDTVKRGSIIRQVRGLGTLVPEDTRWLPSTTEGRVERILLRPGAQVSPIPCQERCALAHSGRSARRSVPAEAFMDVSSANAWKGYETG